MKLILDPVGHKLTDITQTCWALIREQDMKKGPTCWCLWLTNVKDFRKKIISGMDLFLSLTKQLLFSSEKAFLN